MSETERDKLGSLAESAWVLIAGVDWDNQTNSWEDAAGLWRDNYNAWLASRLPAEPPKGSVVMDGNGTAWQNTPENYWSRCRQIPTDNRIVGRLWVELIAEVGPVTRLVPDRTGTLRSTQ